MKIGINIRVMGPQSSPEIISTILKAADAAGIESAWIVDHIAIPPDDSEGSGGRYLDPLTTLGWMAAQTHQIMIGTSVLVLPYRPKLPTAKSLATIQELSGGRLLLGVGIGWMEPEFKALGIAKKKRREISDEALGFFNQCFSNDEITSNGQKFLFRPRPLRPPIYIGGRAPHAIERALKFGDGWLPMGSLAKLAPDIDRFKSVAAEQGHPGEVVTFAALNDDDEPGSREIIETYRQAGITRIIVGKPYAKAEEWLPTIEMIARLSELV